MDETVQSNSEHIVYDIQDDPVMQSAIDVVGLFGKEGKVILKARGNSIPNAVAVANILTENMLKGNSKIEKIHLDTVEKAGIGRMTSTIEIVLLKNN